MNETKENEDFSTTEAIMLIVGVGTVLVILSLLLVFLLSLAISLGIDAGETIIEYFIWRGGVIGG